MSHHTKLPPAYPPRYYRERWRGLGCLAGPFLFFMVVAGAFVATFWFGVGGIGQWLGLSLALLLAGTVIVSAINSVRLVRIYPYYDQRLPGAETYLSGYAIARNCLRLDALAQARGVKSVSGFGFADPLADETRPWHDASEGLASINAILDAVREKPDSVDDAGQVLRELELIRDAFILAQKAGVRFAFLLELGDGTNARVWEIRQGHIG